VKILQWFPFALLLFLVPDALAQGTDLPARLRSAIQRFVDEKEISGAVALVGDANGILALEVVGRSELEGGRPMRPDTLFRIASMTKPITAIGVMILLEGGKLSLDDPVEKHLPEFSGQMMLGYQQADSYIARRPARPITLRDLLTPHLGPARRPPARLARARREARDHARRSLREQRASPTLVRARQPLVVQQCRDQHPGPGDRGCVRDEL